MRTLGMAAAVVLATSTAAVAAPSSITVSVGPELQAKADSTYGRREVAELAADLRTQVNRALARSSAYDGARLELVLVDAVPNRPTNKQLADRPGLSLQSFGVGGARIEGRAVLADGRSIPVGYRYYESDFHNGMGASTWTDARRTFDFFAYRLTRGQALAQR